MLPYPVWKQVQEVVFPAFVSDTFSPAAPDSYPVEQEKSCPTGQPEM